MHRMNVKRGGKSFKITYRLNVLCHKNLAFQPECVNSLYPQCNLGSQKETDQNQFVLK